MKINTWFKGIFLEGCVIMTKMIFMALLITLFSAISFSADANIELRDTIIKKIENAQTIDDIKNIRDIVSDYLKESKLDFNADYEFMGKMLIKEIRNGFDKKSIYSIIQILLEKYKESDVYTLKLMLDRDRLFYSKTKISNEIIIKEKDLLLNVKSKYALEILKYQNSLVDSMLISENRDFNEIKYYLYDMIDFNTLQFSNCNNYKEINSECNDAAVKLVGYLNDSEIKKLGLNLIALGAVERVYPEKSKLINWSHLPHYNTFLWNLSMWLEEAIKENENNKDFVKNFSAVYSYLEDEKLKREMITEKKMPSTIQNRTKMLTAKNINKEADTLYNKSVINFAVISGDIELVKMLLDKGINIDVKDTDGKSPIDYANENVKNKVAGSEKIAELLTEYMKRK